MPNVVTGIAAAAGSVGERRPVNADAGGGAGGLANRDADRSAPLARPLGCATVQTRQNDPHAATVVLPPDELAARRQTKRAGRLTPSQVQRLLIAAELRKKATQGERDE
jgi:hypothetical protein